MDYPSSVRDALQWSIPILAFAGVDTPRLDAQLLLAWVLGGRREDLARSPERPLSLREQLIFDKAIRLRAQRRPLPYITGEAPFYGRSFKVNRAVLIPRPETELIVDIARRHRDRTAGSEPFRLADIGTGSGCIAVTIACEMEDAQIVATDISRLALHIAAKNMRRYGVSDRIDLREGSLCAPLESTDRFNAIVSNPPYVDLATSASLMPEVRDYEPSWALYGIETVDEIDNDSAGLPRSIRRRFLEESKGHLVPGGLVAVEIGAGQADEALEDAHHFGYQEIGIVEDYAGIPRVVTGCVKLEAECAMGTLPTCHT